MLFGTDAYSEADSPLTDYEEKEWLMTDNARRALSIALSGMLHDGLITRTRALQIANMVLHDTAASLYQIQ